MLTFPFVIILFFIQFLRQEKCTGLLQRQGYILQLNKGFSSMCSAKQYLQTESPPSKSLFGSSIPSLSGIF